GRQGDLSCQRLNPAGQPRPIHLLRSTMAFVLGRRRERPVRTFDLPACVGSDLSDLVHARPQLTAGQRKHTTQGEPPIANGAHEMKARFHDMAPIPLRRSQGSAYGTTRTTLLE